MTSPWSTCYSRQLLSPLLADSLVEIYAEHRPEQLTNFLLHSWVKKLLTRYYLFFDQVFMYVLSYVILSLVPRLSWEGKESLVTTACACANPYQQNMVSCFSLKKCIVIGWRWCLQDFNKETRAYVDFLALRMTVLLCLSSFRALARAWLAKYTITWSTSPRIARGKIRRFWRMRMR